MDGQTSGETVYRSIDYIKDGKRQKTQTADRQTDTETNRSITLKMVKLKETDRQQMDKQAERQTDK